ncbi:DUF4474 domain-containing protein [Vallitalea okinawensis]|uniref:DUF4474 domain-containing protein n=1 Tax=Vallitalea okinawensis TaxID=2078660 RepID=UPI001FA8B38B|nr:DUF4474 domain-containing protein [Vallitalea okinawensis]
MLSNLIVVSHMSLNLLQVVEEKTASYSPSYGVLLLILLVLILSVSIVILYSKYLKIKQKYSKYFMTSIKERDHKKNSNDDLEKDLEEDEDDPLATVMEASGFVYNPKKDIFYSHRNPWQRKFGYCRLYDEASAPLGMIIDCEPIYFRYKGRRWLIEFWKGQYDLTTGCEIGVYATDGPDLDIPGLFNGTFYHSVGDKDMLKMSYTLRKNGRILFRRKAKHWWLTGFKLGEFSQPMELSMDISILLKDESMLYAFLKGLKNAGYDRREIRIQGTRVDIKFDKPHVPQPLTRTKETDRLIQMKNKLMCDQYQEITRGYKNMPNKLNAIRKQSPELYEKIMHIGKIIQFFDIYKTIDEYL